MVNDILYREYARPALDIALLMALFSPRSIAVVGASSDPAKLGGRPVHYLKTLGYSGLILPVNGSGGMVQGLPAYRSVADLPETPEQALIIVPAPAVEAAVADCAARGTPVVQILSSGFADAGPEGEARQAKVMAIARGVGMRVVGPNALGTISVPDGLFATFTTTLDSMRFRPGHISFVTQSGALGSHAYAAANLRGLGICRAIATGNEADLDVADCISLLAEDPATRVICAALEGCRDGNRFRAALLKAARARKPVLVLKVGGSPVGAAAAATHTGSLAGEDRVYDAILRECGAWRAPSIETMLDVAQLCIACGPPSGCDVGLLSISGGIGVLMADVASASGLGLPEFPPGVLGAVADALPAAAGANPIDTTANVVANMACFETLLRAIFEQTPVSAIVVYLAHMLRNPAQLPLVLDGLRRVRQAFPDRPLIVAMTMDPAVRDALAAIGIPSYDDPSRAVNALAAAASLRKLAESARPLPAIDTRQNRDLARGGRNEMETKGLLASAGLTVLPERAATDPQQAVEAAEAVGFPVVAKILSPDLQHKSEIGGVLLNLADAAAVREGFVDLLRRAALHAPGARIDGVLIAPMAGKGLETILGTRRDLVFGPMVMFGLGGINVELFGDVAFASAPLSEERAEDLIDRVRGAAQLLAGWRGAPALDRPSLVRALCRLSDFAAAQVEDVAGVEVNPLLVQTCGSVALDAVLHLDDVR